MPSVTQPFRAIDLSTSVEAAKREASMSEPIAHHWWPVFHQRYWTNPTGEVYRINRIGHRAKGPKGNAVIDDDNTVTLADGTEDRSTEKWFGEKVETPAGSAFQTLKTIGHLPSRAFVGSSEYSARIGGDLGGVISHKTLSLTPRQRLDIGRYVASTVVRVPSYRYQISGALEALRMRAEQERGERIAPPTFAESRNDQIKWMRLHLEDFAAVIAKSYWLLSESDLAQGFIFGDTPVIPYLEPNGRSSLVVPLFPNLVLNALLEPAGNPVNTGLMINRCGRAMVDEYNLKMICQSQAFVFSNRPPTPPLQMLVAQKLSSWAPQIAGPSDDHVRRWLNGL